MMRLPGELRLHPAVQEFGLFGLLGADDAPGEVQKLSITLSGIILTGFRIWQSAMCDPDRHIACIEYQIPDDKALTFIVCAHLPRSGWNKYVRVCLALHLKPQFEQTARENMRAGGKLKGLAKLPEAEHLVVVKKIAKIAGVGARTVSNVERILEHAPEGLKSTLRVGALSINQAMKLTKLPQHKQLEALTEVLSNKNEIIRSAIVQRKNTSFGDSDSLLDALRRHDAHQPGSIIVRRGRQRQTVILIGEDFANGPYAHLERARNEV